MYLGMTTMQISPISTLDDETNQIRELTARIVADEIIPNEHLLRRGAESAQLWSKIQNRVKESGLWAPHLPEEYGGMGIGFLKLAYMNEILAWSPYSNPAFGIMAPNSGNQKILVKYGTDEQKKKWLEPLVRVMVLVRASSAPELQRSSDKDHLPATIGGQNSMGEANVIGCDPV